MLNNNLPHLYVIFHCSTTPFRYHIESHNFPSLVTTDSSNSTELSQQQSLSLSSVHVGVDDAGQEEHREGHERARGHDGEVVRVGHLQPPGHDEDATEQRVADVRQVQVVLLDQLITARRRVCTSIPPAGRFPLSRGRHEAVDDAVVVEAALFIFFELLL